MNISKLNEEAVREILQTIVDKLDELDMEMIELKNKAEAERDFYFKMEADKQKCCQELHLKISEMQKSINFWMKAKDEIEQSCKHEFQADTDGHPYCRKCGRYAYSNTYKPICTCEDRNTDYHLTVCCAPKILVNKEVAKKWADEMLAQAKYARLSPQSLVDLLNEIRKRIMKSHITHIWEDSINEICPFCGRDTKYCTNAECYLFIEHGFSRKN